jgi:hypothetical protein
MPSHPHDIVVAAIAAEPGTLGMLAAVLLGEGWSVPPRLSDSTVRSSGSIEVRPDLLFIEEGGDWLAVEVQHAIDHEKERRWQLLAAVMHDQRGAMGDLLVLTPRRHVARWARHLMSAEGPRGSRMRLTPVVLHVGEVGASKILAHGDPKLALFAAWAVRHRVGLKAEAIVRRALGLARRLPKPLREGTRRAILDLLNKRLLKGTFREKSMPILDFYNLPESENARLVKKWIAEIYSLRAALLSILKRRKFTLTPKAQERIETSRDQDALTRWIKNAFTATTIPELFANPDARRRSSAANAARPTARAGVDLATKRGAGAVKTVRADRKKADGKAPQRRRARA